MSPALITVGFIPNPSGCNPLGLAFDRTGKLYVADPSGGTVWMLAPDATTPPTATPFAAGVPGTNALAFDRDGNLWTGDGGTGLGRVWKIAATGGTCEPSFSGCLEAFRVQPMRNGTDLGGNIAAPGVGRENRTLPLANAQNIVANGLAFTPEGDLYVADTARGAIWKVALDRRGNLQSRTGCDTTFAPNTLCLDNILVAHPYLEGTDGIALDRAGQVWNAVNERNAIVAATKAGQVVEAFRNPVNAAGLRNAGNTTAENQRILEFPTSPVLLGNRLCTASSDGNRRDNSPNAAGEINVAGLEGARGKISCLDQELSAPGVRLPIR